MTDLMHNHLTIELRPLNKCPACDQMRLDLLVVQSKYRVKKLLTAAGPSG